mmetsp:Transcript_6523/g.14256  ORF Transcript_6523/g.14256 Transcript_6523/m.14256 type:complete len:206 (-) Transcript_6523:14-631(-)
MGNLLHTVQGHDVLQRVDRRRQTAVQAEDLLLNERRQGQVVKEVGEVLPHVSAAVLAQALIVETVDLRDLTALVVASEDSNAVGKPHFEGHQQRDRLHGVVATVHVVAHEQVVRVRRLSSDAEQLHQVVELPVDVTTDGHGAVDRLNILFLDQNVASFVAQLLDLVLGQVLALVELLNPGIQLAVLLCFGSHLAKARAIRNRNSQ